MEQNEIIIEIKENLTDMENIISLMSLPQYQSSTVLEERYNNLKNESERLNKILESMTKN